MSRLQRAAIRGSGRRRRHVPGVERSWRQYSPETLRFNRNVLRFGGRRRRRSPAGCQCSTAMSPGPERRSDPSEEAGRRAKTLMWFPARSMDVASPDMDGTAPKGGHTVLAEADGTAYRSLRQRPVTRAERYALGKSLRK